MKDVKMTAGLLVLAIGVLQAASAWDGDLLFTEQDAGDRRLVKEDR